MRYRQHSKDMTKEELRANNCTPIEDLITEDFGEIGTPERDSFEIDCDAFIIGEHLKEERRKAGLSQAALAEKIGTKKSFISRIEHGYADIQLSTLARLFQGFGKKVRIVVS